MTNLLQTLKDLLPAAGLCALSVLLVSGLMLWPDREAQAYAVVMPPGLDELAIMSRVAASGGRVVRFGAASSIAIVDFGQPVERASLEIPDALFVMQPLLLGGCQSPDEVEAARVGLAMPRPAAGYTY